VQSIPRALRWGAQAGAETGAAIPLSNQRIFKPCCGTGSSSDQAVGECQPRISIVRWNVAGDSRLRSSAHEPGEVVVERGYPGADSIHPGNSRIEELNNRYGRDLRLVLLAARTVCNTTTMITAMIIMPELLLRAARRPRDSRILCAAISQAAASAGEETLPDRSPSARLHRRLRCRLQPGNPSHHRCDCGFQASDTSKSGS
jgi:hypothetical protein